MKNAVLLVLLSFASILITQAQINVLDEASRYSTLSQEAVPAPPASIFSRGDLFETLDQAFLNITSSSTLKGFNAALITSEGDVWKNAVGLAQELPDTVLLNTEHLMGMGSISKSFVSAALLLLVEDGLLGLDDPIGDYLDDYPNISGDATIKQLLSHRTGFLDYINENVNTGIAITTDPDSIWEIDTLLTHYLGVPNFPVGTDWSYSNTNYLLAGRIIENITGKDWYDIVRERIIEPMQLTHTFTYPFESPGSQVMAHCWADLDANGTVEDMQGSGFPMEGFFSAAASAGGLITTPEDLVQFSKQLYGGGFLEPATLMEMQTNYTGTPTFVYGLGAFSLPSLAVENWGHDGSLIYKSVAFYFPEEDMAIAIQQTDNRIGSAYIDVYDVLNYLLNAYLNYDPPTGINVVAADGNLKIYPNPANQFISINLPKELNSATSAPCSIINMKGEIIRHFELSENNTQVNIDNLPAGIYILKTLGYAGKFLVTEQLK